MPGDERPAGLLDLERGELSEPLTAQLRLLGELLTSALRDREGPERIDLLLELVDLCRRADRLGDDELRDRAASRLTELDVADLVVLLRALTALFHLWNQAEKVEIMRINRERSGREAPRPESIREAFGELLDGGGAPEDLARLVERLDVVPTLTAHPTEARRPVVLHKQRRIAELLRALADARSMPAERRTAERRLGHKISLLLATEDVAPERPSVEQEVEQGLYFLTGSIWEAVPRLQIDLDQGLRAAGGEAESAPPVIRLRSWIGGDRDGNPRVTAGVSRWTLRRLRGAALEAHLRELDELEDELAVSERLVPVPEELRDCLRSDLEELSAEVDVAGETDAIGRLAAEPHRLAVRLLRLRLSALLRELRADGEIRADAFGSADYRRRLDLLDESLAPAGLAEAAREGQLGRVRLLARVFGFHLAALDVRQHSGVHERAVHELLERAGVNDGYLELDESERLELLTRELASPRPLLPRAATTLDEATEDLLATLDLLRRALDTEPASVGGYVVSMTHTVSDLLEVLLLFRETGLRSGSGEAPAASLDVVPLFETIEDLELAGERLDALLSNPVYRRHVAARGDFQEVMIGYSDSNKDGGYWMANWALHRSLERLGTVCRRHGVEFRVFHGQGGTVGRGGGRASRAISAQPSEVHNGRIRFTEQGEVISFRYGSPDLAHRHLEQVVSALLRSTAAARGRGRAKGIVDRPPGLVADLAATAMEAYRELLARPDFGAWYRSVTPIEHISRLPIASRPPARAADSGGATTDLDFDSLRAIPWVFSWNQTRYLVPGWYGTGRALGRACEVDERRAELRRLYREWPFFATVVDNAQLEMARARLEISRRYAALAAEDGAEIHRLLADDFRRARAAILAVTGQDDLLDNDPVIRSTIRVRNPYTDVLNLLQIELMRRHRGSRGEADREPLSRALFVSINGIAAAMQSTG